MSRKIVQPPRPHNAPRLNGRFLTKRRTNRQPFTQDPVPPSLLKVLCDAAREEEAWLEVIRTDETRHAAADLIAEGDRRQWANKRFRLELAAWIHPNRSWARDGIPGYAQGIEDLLSYAEPLVVRTFNMGEGQAAMNHELATGSPALVVLGTAGDTVRDWIHAGQALARILLRARVEDVWPIFNSGKSLRLPTKEVTKTQLACWHYIFCLAVISSS